MVNNKKVIAMAALVNAHDDKGSRCRSRVSTSTPMSPAEGRRTWHTLNDMNFQLPADPTTIPSSFPTGTRFLLRRSCDVKFRPAPFPAIQNQRKPVGS